MDLSPATPGDWAETNGQFCTTKQYNISSGVLFQYLLMIYSRMTSATTKELHCFSTLFYALEFIQLVQHTVLCIRVHTTGELNTDHTTTDIDTDTDIAKLFYQSNVVHLDE